MFGCHWKSCLAAFPQPKLAKKIMRTKLVCQPNGISRRLSDLYKRIFSSSNGSFGSLLVGCTFDPSRSVPLLGRRRLSTLAFEAAAVAAPKLTVTTLHGTKCGMLLWHIAHCIVARGCGTKICLHTCTDILITMPSHKVFGQPSNSCNTCCAPATLIFQQIAGRDLYGNWIGYLG